MAKSKQNRFNLLEMFTRKVVLTYPGKDLKQALKMIKQEQFYV